MLATLAVIVLHKVPVEYIMSEHLEMAIVIWCKTIPH